MSYIDIALILALVLGAFIGYKDGFLMELFSVIAIVLGILAGFKLMGYAMVLLDQKFNIDESVLPYLAFGVVFIAVMLVVILVGRSFKASIDKTFLGRVDKLAGGFLGLFKTAFLLSVVLWILDSLEIAFPSNWTHQAWLYPKLASVAPSVAEWVGDFIPFFEDVFRRFNGQ